MAMPNSLARSAATSASSRLHMRLTCDDDSLSIPILCAMRSTLRAETPLAYTSATAAATALSARLHLSSIPSGK